MRIDEVERKTTLEKISDYTDGNYYVTFTQIEKVGINPQSVHDETPNSVYAYPLSSPVIQRQLSENIDHIKYIFPYASDTPWVNILAPVRSVQEVSDYTEQQFKEDMVKIVKLTDFQPSDIVNMFGRELAYMDEPFEKFWYVTGHISKAVSKKPNNYWTMLLIKMGYNGFEDKYGKGLIYKTEPVQALFLKPDSYRIVNRFRNDWKDI